MKFILIAVILYGLILYLEQHNILFDASFSLENNKSKDLSTNNEKVYLTFYKFNNYSKIEFALPEENADTSTYINSIIASVSAIGGGIIGASLTYIYGRRIEESKSKKEKEREQIFNNNIKRMVSSELKEFSRFISSINSVALQLKTEEPTIIDPDVYYITDNSMRINLKQKLLSLPRQYDQLTIDRKSNVFDGDSLIKVENCYQKIKNFTIKDYSQYKNCFSYTELTEIMNSLHEAQESIKFN